MDHDLSGARACGEASATPPGAGIKYDRFRLSYGTSFPVAFALPAPSLPLLFWFLLFVAALLALCWLTRRKRLLENERGDPWSDPELVENILTLALDQRAPISVRFASADAAPNPDPDALFGADFGAPNTSGASGARAASFPIRGAWLALDGQSLSLRLDEAPPTDLRPGRPVRASFCLSLGQNVRLYRFHSLALRLHAPHEPGTSGAPETPGAACILELARPVRLTPFQRRARPRLSPRREQVAALGLWNITAPLPPPDPAPNSAPIQDPIQAPIQTLDAGGVHGATSRQPPGSLSMPLPGDASALPAPLLACRPPHKEQAHLATISAAGLGLRMSRRRALSIAPTCLVFLSLNNRWGKPLNLWLACARRHVTALAGRNAALVGLRLLAWARVTDADSAIRWRPGGAEGEAEPLKLWLMRRLAAEGLPPAYVNLLTKE